MAQALREFIQLGLNDGLKPLLHIQTAQTFRQRVELRRSGKAQHNGGTSGRTFAQRAGDVDAAAVLRLAVVFLAGVLLGGRITQQIFQPFGFSFRRPGFFGDLTDSLIKALRNGRFNIHAVNGVAFFPRAAVGDNGIEQIINAVMGGNQTNIIPPHGQRQCGLQYRRKVSLKGGLINDDVALHTAQV